MITHGRLRRALTRMRLPIVPGEWILPKLGWWPYGSGLDFDIRLVKPTGPIDYHLYSFNAKPTGGLWTSPVERLNDTLLGTKWSRYWDDSYDGPIWLIEPDADARVLVLDRSEHLQAAIDRWPETHLPEEVARFRGGRHTFLGHPALIKPIRLDYAAMAEDIDAIWLTQNGLHTVASPGAEPNLHGWDCETVLFLNTTFTFSKPIQRPDKKGRQAVRSAHAKALADEVRDELRKQGDLTDEAEKAISFIQQMHE